MRYYSRKKRGRHFSFTTGEVAKIIGCSARTVTKYMESGQLAGYLLPNSRDRRFSAESLRDFCRKNKVPLDLDLIFMPRLLVCSTTPGAFARPGWLTAYTSNPFQAQKLIDEFAPRAVVVDTVIAGRDLIEESARKRDCCILLFGGGQMDLPAIAHELEISAGNWE